MMLPLSLKLYIFSSSLSKIFAIKVFWIFKFAKFSGFHMSHHHNLSMRFHLPQGRFFLCISICTMQFKILLQLKILTMTMWKYRASETSSGIISFWIFFFFYFFKNSRDQLIFFFQANVSYDLSAFLYILRKFWTVCRYSGILNNAGRKSRSALLVRVYDKLI